MGAYLLAHGLGIGDGRGEEAVVLHAAIQAGPLVVTVAGEQGVSVSVGFNVCKCQ